MAFENSQINQSWGNPLQRRRIDRVEPNPNDKATIVSIYPREIIDRKTTVFPGYFEIPGGSYEYPSTLQVGPSSWFKDFDPDQPLIEVPVNAAAVAKSVVNDYCIGLLGYSAEARPGIFYITGSVMPSEVRKSYMATLDVAMTRQNNWYMNLVRMADILWARSNGNPIVINDDMRFAAKALNIEGKDWMSQFKMADKIKCVACGTPRDKQFPMCANCKHINDVPLAISLGLLPDPDSQYNTGVMPNNTNKVVDEVKIPAGLKGK